MSITISPSKTRKVLTRGLNVDQNTLTRYLVRKYPQSKTMDAYLYRSKKSPLFLVQTPLFFSLLPATKRRRRWEGERGGGSEICRRGGEGDRWGKWSGAIDGFLLFFCFGISTESHVNPPLEIISSLFFSGQKPPINSSYFHTSCVVLTERFRPWLFLELTSLPSNWCIKIRALVRKFSNIWNDIGAL